MRRSWLAVVAPVVVLAASCTSGGTGGTPTTPGSTPPASVSTPLSQTAVGSSPATRPSGSSPGPTPRRQRSSPAPSSSSVAVPNGTVPAGTVVVLNPGHNGGDAGHLDQLTRQVPAGYGKYKDCETTGTATNAGYPEHAFNWDVALRVRKTLREHGVQVVLTRDSDTGFGPCVDRRAAIGNAPDVAAVVSIHADGAPSSGHGFHVNQAARTPDGATRAVAREADVLGQDIHRTLVDSSGLVPSTYIGRDGYFYRSDLAGLNLATRPATFLELGNMRNSADAALQSSPSGRRRIAAAIAAGILVFLGD